MQSEQSLLPMDIEWTRSSQIRMAVAGFFDDPMAANALQHMSELRVVVHPKHRMAGLQLAGMGDSKDRLEAEQRVASGE